MTREETIRTIRLARRLAACFALTHAGGDQKAHAAFMAAFPELGKVYLDPRLIADEEMIREAISGKSEKRKYESATIAGLTLDFSNLVTAVFHLGFLSIIETEEQLARLDIDPKPKPKAKVARSKIGKTNRRINPIDGTAARVAPTEPPVPPAPIQ